MGNVASDTVDSQIKSGAFTTKKLLRNKKHLITNEKNHNLIKSHSNLYNPSSLSFNLNPQITPSLNDYGSKSSNIDEYISGDVGRNDVQYQNMNILNSSFKKQKNNGKKKRSLSTSFLPSSTPPTSSLKLNTENCQYSLGYVSPKNGCRHIKSFYVQKGYSIVELTRSNSSQFGLTIAGGTDKDSRPRICDLKPGSIAHRCDELQIGDMIISINGIKTQGLKHEEIIDLIKNAGDALCLEFEYNLPPWPIHPHHAVRSQTVSIQLEKETTSYGFTIRGGFNEEKVKSRPLIVTNIRAGGPADREGTLKIGDRIIAINGINVLTASLQDAYFILKQCKGLTLFLVEYDSAIVDSIKNSNGPLLIEIEKSPGSSIGIKLTTCKNPIDGKNQILVESVKPASIADRCGAIYAGDQILSIDDVSFEHVSLMEANQILKNCVGEFSRVEILPLSQLHSAIKPNNQQKSSSKSLVDLNKEYRLVDMQKFGSLNSCSASLNTNQVCHPEKVEISLRADDNGTFGFTLQGASMVSANHDLVQSVPLYPVIGYVEPNSVAERCGILQPGDRIQSVNKNSLEGLSLEDARQIIKDAGVNLNLEIEFDVADSIILSSGIFQVKLLKKNLDLGLSVAYSKFVRSENYPVISAIKKGSVAYRSGMLQTGDQILYIDSTCLKNKPLEEISQLLGGNEEIVKLKIKKDELFTEETIDEKTVVYTVEMEKNGGPLGITISGSDDLFEPMFVSGLIEGGLAERTNAIHVGDVILAINNVSLKGKSLAEAIELLKNAGDMVTLKISRKLEQNVHSSNMNQSGNFHHHTPMKQHDNHQLAEMNNNIHGTPLKFVNNRSMSDQHQQQSHLVKNVENGVSSSRACNIQYNHHVPHQQHPNFGYGNSVNEKTNDNSDFINNEYQKSLQYLPFPMNMTHFIKEPSNKAVPNSGDINNKILSNNSMNMNNAAISSNSSSCSSNMSTINTTSTASNTNNPSISFNNQGSLGRNTNHSSFDLTNGISVTTAPKINNNTYNDRHYHQRNYPPEDCNIKKKAASIDSINAVERELDEVLKDLELNSQDLNDHLNFENQTATQTAKNVVELPITIQKNIKIEQISTNGSHNGISSPIFNKPNNMHQLSSNHQNHIANSTNHVNNQPRWNQQYSEASASRNVGPYGGAKIQNSLNAHNHNSSSINESGPIKQNHLELYIEDNLENDQESNSYGNKKQIESYHTTASGKLPNANGTSNVIGMANNDPRKRQNIVSTYELCHECFDSNSLVASPSNINGKSQQLAVSNANNLRSTPSNSTNAVFNNKIPASNIKSMQNINAQNKPLSLPQYQSCLHNGNNVNSPSPVKMISSSSNHELTNSARSHSLHSHIGHDSSSGSGLPSAHNHFNTIEVDESRTNNLSQNGHVVSQKVISIGLPNNNGRNDEHSSTSIESKSISSKNEEKLDRLPPVPPSSWSSNSSIKRRNQYNHVPQNGSSVANNNCRLKKFNVNTSTTANTKDQGEGNQQNSNMLSYQQSYQMQTNGHHSGITNKNEIKTNGSSNGNANSELSIGENDRDNHLEASQAQQGYNLKNYDNLNVNNKQSNNHLNDDVCDRVNNYAASSSDDDKIEIIISRDDRFNDFGFTLAKSMHGIGIFVEKIRIGSPAENNLYFKPNTKLFKINNFDCTKIDIAQANKYLVNEQASKSNIIKLVISATPKNVLLCKSFASDDEKNTISFDPNNCDNSVNLLANCKATAL